MINETFKIERKKWLYKFWNWLVNYYEKRYLKYLEKRRNCDEKSFSIKGVSFPNDSTMYIVYDMTVGSRRNRYQIILQKEKAYEKEAKYQRENNKRVPETLELDTIKYIITTFYRKAVKI
jgi:hypothetical protein